MFGVLTHKSRHAYGQNCLVTTSLLDLVQSLVHHPYSDLEWSILAVDTPQWHHHSPRRHHTQYPTHWYEYRSRLCPHLECYLLPVAADQLYMGLHDNQINIINHIVAKHSWEIKLDTFEKRLHFLKVSIFENSLPRIAQQIIS